MASRRTSGGLTLLCLLLMGQTCVPVSVSEPSETGISNIGAPNTEAFDAGGSLFDDPALTVQRRLDRDLDGFIDKVDPAPGDPDVPANVGSPEAILANSWVIQALYEARGLGLSLDPITDRAAFDLAGTYAWTSNTATFLLTSDATDEGVAAAPGQFGLTRAAGGLYHLSEGQEETKENELANSGLVHLRGTRQHFTLYAVDKSECDVGGPRYSVSIRDGAVASNGDIVGMMILNVLLAIEGRPVCDIPGGEEPGGWQVVAVERMERK